MTERIPAEVFPPGEYLRDELEARGWTQTEFAEIIGRPPRVVNEIIAGKRAISPETAREFAAAFETTAQFWMNLETAYQLSRTDPASERIAREARLRERFPVREMMKRGWIEPSKNFEVVETRVLEFFGMQAANDPFPLAHAAFRNHREELSAIQQAWISRVKQLAEALPAVKYSESALRNALTRLRHLVSEAEEVRHIARILEECGVRLVVVEPFPGSKIDGVCLWLDDGKRPVIGMSLRQDRIDNFWFVLAHEIEHVLRGDGKEGVIIDTDLEACTQSDELPEAEVAANEAAANFAVEQSKIDSFVARTRPLYSEQRILNFAKANGVHPGVVVGQLQFRKEIPYTHFAKHKVKIRHLVVPATLSDGWGAMPQLSGRTV